MKKVAVIGHYGAGKDYLDGQTIKTKIITQELLKRFGANEVTSVDTHGGAKRLVEILFSVVKVLITHKNVIILPADKGLKTLAPWLVFWNLFCGKKIHYCVIGGWLPELIKRARWLLGLLNRFSGIYVETSTMQRRLEKMGLNNTVLLPNCKDLPILSKDFLIYPDGEPYRLCTFSRVMKKKGIEDAINAVLYANSKIGRTVYLLDIYGQINPREVEWFNNLKSQFPAEVKYKGTVPFDQSVGVLKDYYALLFPTRFYTEGIPGTIIDAYCAGIPVISARWESFNDIVVDGITGVGYEFENTHELEELLISYAAMPNQLQSLKPHCLEQAIKHSPKEIVTIIIERLA